MIKRKSEIVLKTSSAGNDAVPADLNSMRFWYNTDEVVNDYALYKSNTDGTTGEPYAIWKADGISAFYLTAESDIDNETADGFMLMSATPFGEFLAINGADGSVTASSPTIMDSWYRSETTVFGSLLDFIGGTENLDSFRGTLPVTGDSDDLALVNVWQMTSGGSGDFDIDRLSGENSCWSTLRTDCLIDSLWETRQRAMEFAGLVQAWLIETNNMMDPQEGYGDCVIECRLTDIPLEPSVYRTQGENRQEYWKQEINLEIIYEAI